MGNILGNNRNVLMGNMGNGNVYKQDIILKWENYTKSIIHCDRNHYLVIVVILYYLVIVITLHANTVITL